ncbi:YbaB/EbfC family DNA-binding protein [Nonomuraea phyllanthi]|uniref:YbaB/EbfC family DNA-binding protein n=2 Tax=Nonomuraea phyllanthi TaxID=2219224 RepID=A0A5C4WZQ7_9ACTN|nr:YbaB/EbfC family DNA-binding protein [Nonomuraea phyllanthi]QFY14021.1 YbaB/EbfC family DNA-binding protein [Nonomuraea phyllanthi]
MEELQKAMADMVGTATDESKFVTVEYAGEGIRELTIHPKAMRLSSGELADIIKQVVADAAEDLQRQVNEAMSEVFGEEDNPMNLINDPEGAMQQIRSAEEAYNRTFDDVMGELDRIRRRLDL